MSHSDLFLELLTSQCIHRSCQRKPMKAIKPSADNSSLIYYSPCRLCVGSQLTNLLAVSLDARPCLPALHFPLIVSRVHVLTPILSLNHTTTTPMLSLICLQIKIPQHFQQKSSMITFILLIHCTLSSFFSPMYCITLDPHSEISKLLKR